MHASALLGNPVDTLIHPASMTLFKSHFIIMHFSLHNYAVAAVCYFVFLYCKHSRKRRGSYDVQRRRKASDVESGTSSARSSFRAVSEYHYSPSLENRFLNEILPGSTTSMSEQSTTSTVPHEESLRSSLPSESESAASSAASESSAESESQPLRLDRTRH